MPAPLVDPRTKTVTDLLHASASVKERTAESCTAAILAAADAIAATFRNGGKLLLCGEKRGHSTLSLQFATADC